MADVPRWIEYLDLDALVPDPRNPKGHADGDIDASFDRFDYTEPGMIDERTGQLVAGHGRRERLLARRVRGEAPPEGVVLREDGAWMVPIVRGWSSQDDDHALAYVVASNGIPERGGWADSFASTLEHLRQHEGGLVGTGYSSQDVDDLLASLTPPVFDPVPDDDQPRLDIRAMVTCPHCGQEFQRN